MRSLNLLLLFSSAGQPQTTTLTTPQPYWKSGSLWCRSFTTMWSGDQWTSQRKSKHREISTLVITVRFREHSCRYMNSKLLHLFYSSWIIVKKTSEELWCRRKLKLLTWGKQIYQPECVSMPKCWTISGETSFRFSRWALFWAVSRTNTEFICEIPRNRCPHAEIFFNFGIYF